MLKEIQLLNEYYTTYSPKLSDVSDTEGDEGGILRKTQTSKQKASEINTSKTLHDALRHAMQLSYMIIDYRATLIKDLNSIRATASKFEESVKAKLKMQEKSILDRLREPQRLTRIIRTYPKIIVRKQNSVTFKIKIKMNKQATFTRVPLGTTIANKLVSRCDVAEGTKGRVVPNLKDVVGIAVSSQKNPKGNWLCSPEEAISVGVNPRFYYVIPRIPT